MLPCYMHYIKKRGDGLVLHDREEKKLNLVCKVYQISPIMVCLSYQLGSHNLF